MTVIRPMLAHTVPVTPEDIEITENGVWLSPKLDGIRNMQMKSVSMSRTLKPLPNLHIQSRLAHHMLDGLDGEIVVGSPVAPDCINATTSGVMTIGGEPDFQFYVFDCWDSPSVGFSDRKGYVRRRLLACLRLGLPVVRVPQVLCRTVEEIEAAVGMNYERGFEGSIVRSFNGPYKYNRATLKEGLLLKVKESIDSEMLITGFSEMRNNQNVATTDARGFTKRSTHQGNKIAAGTLGRIHGVDVHSGLEIIIGTGKLTAAAKLEIWLNQAKYLGRIAKYRYAAHGIKDLPRHPRFITWRDPMDM